MPIIDLASLTPATPGTVLLEVQSGPSTVEVGGWTRAYGETIDEEEYFGAAVATVASVYTGSPAPLLEYAREHIEEQLSTIASNMGMALAHQFLTDIYMGNGTILQSDGLKFRFGIQTTSRAVTIDVPAPSESNPFATRSVPLFSYNVHTPYMEWQPL